MAETQKQDDTQAVVKTDVKTADLGPVAVLAAVFRGERPEDGVAPGNRERAGEDLDLAAKLGRGLDHLHGVAEANLCLLLGRGGGVHLGAVLIVDDQAAEAEAAQLRAQLQTGGRMPQLLADIDAAHPTIEEREEYEPHIESGVVVYAGVDYGQILREAEAEADVLIWDGGNNDLPFFRPDLMITVVRGGDSPFVIPDEAECMVELRTVPGVRADQAVELVRSLGDASWQWDLELVASREAWQLQAEGPAADLAQGLSSELGTELNFVAPYWMEATLWEEVCPTLICGPTGGGLHAIDEWVDLGQVRSLTSALVKLLA